MKVEIKELDPDTILLNGREYKAEPVKFKVWRPIPGNPAGYSLSEDGSVRLRNSNYLDLYDQGNLFETEIEALNESRLRVLTTRYKRRLAELNEGWWPDWNDYGQKKHYLYFDGFSEHILENFTCKGAFFGSAMFAKDRCVLGILVDEFSKSEIKTIILQEWMVEE